MTTLARTRSDELRSNLRGPLHSDRVNELALSLVVNIGKHRPTQERLNIDQKLTHFMTQLNLSGFEKIDKRRFWD